ncbi:MAG: DUF6084 family protein [Pseudonocardiales bacterium]
MTELTFEILDVQPERYAATPNLLFRLRVTEATGATVHAIALRVQLKIEPQRRSYTPQEKAGLGDLFGTPDRWGETLKPFLWTHAAQTVQGFHDTTEFDLPVICTYDFDVIATKYFQALGDDGEIPVVLLFSGTVFTRGDANGFGVDQVPWDLEASYRLPVRVWREMMDTFFPGGGWIRLDRETLDALMRYRSAHAFVTWEQTFAELLAPAEARQA